MSQCSGKTCTHPSHLVLEEIGEMPPHVWKKLIADDLQNKMDAVIAGSLIVGKSIWSMPPAESEPAPRNRHERRRKAALERRS